MFIDRLAPKFICTFLLNFMMATVLAFISYPFTFYIYHSHGFAFVLYALCAPSIYSVFKLILKELLQSEDRKARLAWEHLKEIIASHNSVWKLQLQQQYLLLVPKEGLVYVLAKDFSEYDFLFLSDLLKEEYLCEEVYYELTILSKKSPPS